MHTWNIYFPRFLRSRSFKLDVSSIRNITGGRRICWRMRGLHAKNQVEVRLYNHFFFVNMCLNINRARQLSCSGSICRYVYMLPPRSSFSGRRHQASKCSPLPTCYNCEAVLSPNPPFPFWLGNCRRACNSSDAQESRRGS